MKDHFNAELFQIRLRAAAYNYSFREAAGEAGVSASTLSRLERGSMPDVPTLYALCAWMRVSPGLFLAPPIETDNCESLRNALLEIKTIVERI